MDADSVDKMLAAYNQCKARVSHIRNQLSIMERQLEYETTHAMEGEALRAQNYDPTPHGNMPGNPVADLAIRYMSGYTPRYIKDMQADIDKAKDELYECEMVTNFVDGWLLCLSDRERFIIEKHVISSGTWRDVLGEYEEKFGPFGKEGLRKMKKRAMSKIYEAAE